MVLHLRSSHDHVAGDLGSQTLHQRHRQGQTHQVLRPKGGRSSESKRVVALKHLSHWPRRIFRCLRHEEGTVQESEGEGKGIERVIEKAPGDECFFIPGRGLAGR